LADLLSSQSAEQSPKTCELSELQTGSTSPLPTSSVSLIISSSLSQCVVLLFFWCFRRRRTRLFPPPGPQLSSISFGDEGDIDGDSTVPTSVLSDVSVAGRGGSGVIADGTGGGGAMRDRSVSTTSGRRRGGEESRDSFGDGGDFAAVAGSLRRACAKLMRGLGTWKKKNLNSVADP